MSWNLNLVLNQLLKVVKTLQTTALTNPLVSNLNFANNSITSCNDVGCVSITSTGASTIPTISNSLTCSSNIIQSDGSGANYLQCGKIVAQRNNFIINTPKTYAIPISSASYNGTTTYFAYYPPLTDSYSIPPGGTVVTISGTNVPAANTTFTLSASGAPTLYAQVNGNPAGLINPTSSSSGLLTWTYSGSAGITFQSDSVAYATFTTASLTLTGNLIAQTISGTTSVITPLIKNGTSDITIGNAQNTAGGFVNIGVMNNASNSYPNVGQNSNNLSIGWNQSGGDAEIDFYNSANTGFNFYGRNTSTSIFQVARMRGDNIASYAFSIGAGAYAYGGAGSYGTSVGANAGNASMTGGSNTLVGYASGTALTNGYYNTCLGTNAGVGLTTGNINTLIGTGAGGGSSNTGAGNVAVGAGALGGTSNSGTNNTAIGRDVLTANSMSGSQNIGIGYNTGLVTSGNNNTLIGQAVARSLTTGGGNICIGYDVGNATTVLTTGSNNTYVGYGANSLNGTSVGEVVLGQARGNGNSSVTLGCNDGLLFLSGWTVAGTQLAVTALGQVYRFSDSRAKTDISYIPKGGHIERLMKLKPAEFKLKIDTIKEKYVGFIAQDVMEVMPNCVDGKKYEYEWEMDLNRNPIRDEDGNVKLRRDENGELIPRYKGLDWNEINTRAILAIQEQNELIVNQQKQIDNQQKQIDELKLLLNQLINKPI